MIRTVNLELLRHGPAHNQLLSPLTAYLALCGNHDAESVHVQMEQLQWSRLQRDLRYARGDRQADERLLDAANEVSRIAASIRSLTAEISAAPRGGKGMVHLRLVVSASELALLPFELLISPPGFPGQGQHLLLQTVSPVTLTREVRGVSPAAIQWPSQPRILIAAASPEAADRAAVPTEAHLFAIKRALEPWLVQGSEGSELRRYVTLLPRATLVQIREACAETRFTHVHVLAHGAEVPNRDELEGRFGLALHADGDDRQPDVVSGARLAAAIRGYASGPSGEISSPAVVTIASCDGGNVGSVIAPGASVAHDLHQSGVPLVVASQFPLSMPGSVIMAQALYARLLRGEDPRVVIHVLRQELHIACPDNHDWASIVAYAALPPDIDEQVRRAKIDRPYRAIEAALGRLDRTRDTASPAERDAVVESLEAAVNWMRAVVPDGDGAADAALRARAKGLLANVEKRWAELLVKFKPGESGRYDDTGSEEEAASWTARRTSREALQEARRLYLETFRLDMGTAWAAVQYLALSVALGDPLDEAWWTTARTLAENGLKIARDDRRRAWERNSLIELAVLSHALPDGHAARPRAAAEAHAHLDELLAAMGAKAFDVYSLRRQLRRYAEWWWKDDARGELAAALGTRLDQSGVPSSWEGG
jgi:hypothetical protein